MKNKSFENLQNQIEQLKTNLSQAVKEKDEAQIKFLNKQIRLNEIVLKRLQELKIKKSEKPS